MNAYVEISHLIGRTCTQVKVIDVNSQAATELPRRGDEIDDCITFTTEFINEARVKSSYEMRVRP